VVDPRPRRPEQTRQQRLGMPRRNVDDQVRDSPFRYRLQMRTDRVDVEALHEFSTWFEDRPSLHQERLQAAPGPLRFYSFQLEPWLVQAVLRVDRVPRR